MNAESEDKSTIELIVRRVPDGICTTYLFDYLKQGDVVKINGPYGQFYLRNTSAPIIFIAGGSGINQFASVGQLSFISAMAKVLHDVPPYMIVEGHPGKPRAVNTVGLKRHDYSREDIKVLSSAFRLLYT